MHLSSWNVRRLAVGGLLVLIMCKPASAQLHPDGSQTREAQARASATKCLRATPLPADTTITPPGADVPADVAIFSGAWGGVWGRTGAGACTTLVVEEVLANGYARVIYSIGVFDPHVRMPRYWRASGRIVDGVLSFRLPAPWRGEYTFRQAGTDLAGTYKEGTVERVVTVAPIGDVRQIGCSPVPLVAAPSGPTRDRILASEVLSMWTGDGPVHNDYFMPIGNMAPARHSLSGTLTIPALRLSSANNGCAGLPSPSPAFTIEFLTHGDHLVPAIRTIIWSWWCGGAGGASDGSVKEMGRSHASLPLSYGRSIAKSSKVFALHMRQLDALDRELQSNTSMLILVLPPFVKTIT